MKEKLKLFKRCKRLLFFVSLFGFQLIYAQQTVSGTVVDNTGAPLPGANVVVKGTNNGTQTDFDGNFSISAAGDATLVISYIGFTAQEVAIDGRSQISVTLVEDASKLDEVVVIGYGTAKKSD